MHLELPKSGNLESCGTIGRRHTSRGEPSFGGASGGGCILVCYEKSDGEISSDTINVSGGKSWTSDKKTIPARWCWGKNDYWFRKLMLIKNKL